MGRLRDERSNVEKKRSGGAEIGAGNEPAQEWFNPLALLRPTLGAKPV